MLESEQQTSPLRITRRGLITANVPSAEPIQKTSHPIAQDTIRLSTNAMACEFTIMLNPVPHEQIFLASEILEDVHEYETQYTVYRETSELIELNRSAGSMPLRVKSNLFELLKLSIEIAHQSHGTYNPLMHPLIQVWRDARKLKMLPNQEDIEFALTLCHLEDVNFHPENHEIFLQKCGMSFNLGSIGKGYAIDQLSKKLLESGINDFLIHAGQSSVYAAGKHGLYDGWPIGISHPNYANRFLGTLLLNNQGMSTSGSGVQFYRVEGKKYGHILDPRTGIPADSTLSAMIFHSSAAIADALSTAAYVAGVNEIEMLAEAFPECGYILLSPSARVHEFEIQSAGVIPSQIYWE